MLVKALEAQKKQAVSNLFSYLKIKQIFVLLLE